MSKERTKLEIIAPSVEEALDKGLNELGLNKEDIDFEVLDEGKKGLLGIGNRQARVVLMVRPQPEVVSQDSDNDVVSSKREIDQGFDETQKLDEEPEEISIARETINLILEKMQVNASVSVNFGDPDSNRLQPILIDVEGDDLSFLIGRKAETINALQFITSLIVGRELGRWVPLVIDIQNYRKRREDELRKLARRIAEQVETTGRRQSLEPMPPNERRIIHIELRDNPNVETASEGEEPARKVYVIPKD